MSDERKDIRKGSSRPPSNRPTTNRTTTNRPIQSRQTPSNRADVRTGTSAQKNTLQTGRTKTTSTTKKRTVPREREKLNIENRTSGGSNKHISKNFTVFMNILALIFFVFIVGQLYGMNNNKSADTMVLEKIDVKKSNFYQGIIIRDERIYKSNNKGFLTYNSRDLEKVKTGDLIFEISDKETVDSLSSELNSVNENLFSLQNFRQEYSMYKRDIDNIESDNKKVVESWNMASYKDLYEISTYLNENNSMRNQIIFSDTRMVDSGKIETKGIIEEKIDTSIIKNYALNSGIVSYLLDGLEETFTVDNIENITKKQTEMDAESKSLPEIIVSEDTNVLKIVESNMWYIATYIPANEEEVQNLQEGNSKRIYIEDAGTIKELESVIYKISDVGDDKFIVFEVKKNMLDFIDERNVNITLKSETFESIRIPTSAVVEKEMIEIPDEYIVKTDKDVVIRQTSVGDTTSIPINIDSRDSTKGVVYLSRDENSLKIGDVLVGVGEEVKTFEIRNYTILKGVYRANDGISRFYKIRENENVDLNNNEEYLYIMPTTFLKEYDRIVVNANEVEENQIIQ